MDEASGDGSMEPLDDNSIESEIEYLSADDFALKRNAFDSALKSCKALASPLDPFDTGERLLKRRLVIPIIPNLIPALPAHYKPFVRMVEVPS